MEKEAIGIFWDFRFLRFNGQIQGDRLEVMINSIRKESWKYCENRQLEKGYVDYHPFSFPNVNEVIKKFRIEVNTDRKKEGQSTKRLLLDLTKFSFSRLFTMNYTKVHVVVITTDKFFLRMAQSWLKKGNINVILFLPMKGGVPKKLKDLQKNERFHLCDFFKVTSLKKRMFTIDNSYERNPKPNPRYHFHPPGRSHQRSDFPQAQHQHQKRPLNARKERNGKTKVDNNNKKGRRRKRERKRKRNRDGKSGVKRRERRARERLVKDMGHPKENQNDPSVLGKRKRSKFEQSENTNTNNNNEPIVISSSSSEEGIQNENRRDHEVIVDDFDEEEEEEEDILGNLRKKNFENNVIGEREAGSTRPRKKRKVFVIRKENRKMKKKDPPPPPPEVEEETNMEEPILVLSSDEEKQTNKTNM